MTPLPPPPPAPGGGLGPAHLALAAVLSSALTGLILVVALAGRTERLGGEVEQSVRRGIEGGVEDALAPDKLQERSAAAGRGLVDGVVAGAFDQLGPVVQQEDLDRAARGAGRVAGEAVDLGLDAMDAFVGPPPAPPEQGDVAAVETRTRGTPEQELAREAGGMARDAVDLGFDLLDAAVGPPRRDGDEHARDR